MLRRPGGTASAGSPASASTASRVVGTWPAGAGRTLGETRRNVCRVRANCESAEAGTEGTGETRGDGRDQTYLPGEMIAWGSSVFLISRTTCQNVVSFWDSQFIV